MKDLLSEVGFIYRCVDLRDFFEDSHNAHMSS